MTCDTLGGERSGDVALGSSKRLLPVLGADVHALGPDEADVRDPEEAEYGGEVLFLKVDRVRRLRRRDCAGAIQQPWRPTGGARPTLLLRYWHQCGEASSKFLLQAAHRLERCRKTHLARGRVGQKPLIEQQTVPRVGQSLALASRYGDDQQLRRADTSRCRT